MEQLEFFAIPSPCVGACEADGNGLCKGCLRSRNERLYWLKMSDAQKHQVIRLIAARRRKLQKQAWEKQQASAELPEQAGLGF
ncbi:DUF1289 domain-containing protein [Neisseria musculi]|uniref:Fe-S protein n=1 Tax=Neisseria musculi TaxID=1815583 RepID=A0A7H1MB83_9NEIS|nr:DUF1289 domain-containing protein [Neisseria musculi]QNT58898.1 hypothetical protein H7A79_2679 [Neisseria musculi]